MKKHVIFNVLILVVLIICLQPCYSFAVDPSFVKNFGPPSQVTIAVPTGFKPLVDYVNYVIFIIQVVLAILVGLIVSAAGLQYAIPDGWGGRGGGQRAALLMLKNLITAELIINIGGPIVRAIIKKAAEIGGIYY